MTLDWSDLNLNGMPAVLRALQELDKREKNLHAGLLVLGDQENPESLFGRLMALEQMVADLRIRLDDLEGVIGARAQPQIVKELGAGWQIVRTATAPNASAATSDQPEQSPEARAINSLGTPSYSWLPDDWVAQYVSAVDGD